MEAFFQALQALELRWDNLDDGCFARAHLMVEALRQMGVAQEAIGKVWIFDVRGGQSGFDVVTRWGTVEKWNQHAAPTLDLPRGNIRVLDPSLSDHPVTQADWVRRFHLASTLRRPQAPSAFPEGYLEKLLALAEKDPERVAAQLRGTPLEQLLAADSQLRERFAKVGLSLPEPLALPQPLLEQCVGGRGETYQAALEAAVAQGRHGLVVWTRFGERPFSDTPWDIVTAEEYLGSDLRGLANPTTLALAFLAQLPTKKR
jgi:hypothetical protein